MVPFVPTLMLFHRRLAQFIELNLRYMFVIMFEGKSNILFYSILKCINITGSASKMKREKLNRQLLSSTIYFSSHKLMSIQQKSITRESLNFNYACTDYRSVPILEPKINAIIEIVSAVIHNLLFFLKNFMSIQQKSVEKP